MHQQGVLNTCLLKWSSGQRPLRNKWPPIKKVVTIANWRPLKSSLVEIQLCDKMEKLVTTLYFAIIEHSVQSGRFWQFQSDVERLLQFSTISNNFDQFFYDLGLYGAINFICIIWGQRDTGVNCVPFNTPSLTAKQHPC